MLKFRGEKQLKAWLRSHRDGQAIIDEVAPGPARHILLIAWTGERIRGHNMLRQLIYRHKTPLLSGKKPLEHNRKPKLLRNVQGMITIRSNFLWHS